jgi:hypothetical protein
LQTTKPQKLSVCNYTSLHELVQLTPIAFSSKFVLPQFALDALNNAENNPDNDPWPEKQRDEEMKEMVGATPIQINVVYGLLKRAEQTPLL